MVAPWATVSKQWRPIVLDAVFRDVNFHPDSMPKVVPLLLARPDLLARVRRIRIYTGVSKSLDDLHATYASFMLSPDFEGLVAILQTVPDLRCLRVPAKPPYAMLLAVAAAGPASRTLRALKLTILPASTGGELDLTRIWNTIRQLRDLKSLEISTTCDARVITATILEGEILRSDSFGLASGFSTPRQSLVNAVSRMIDLAYLKRLTLCFGEGATSSPINLSRRCVSLEQLELWGEEAEHLLPPYLALNDAIGGLSHVASLNIRHFDGSSMESPIPFEAFIKALPASIRQCTISSFYLDYVLPEMGAFKRIMGRFPSYSIFVVKPRLRKPEHQRRLARPTTVNIRCPVRKESRAKGTHPVES